VFKLLAALGVAGERLRDLLSEQWNRIPIQRLSLFIAFVLPFLVLAIILLTR
jgi:hypothetical protein